MELELIFDYALISALGCAIFITSLHFLELIFELLSMFFDFVLRHIFVVKKKD